ncbi:M23 family metallopeptidase [Microbacterium sp. QXD-8]|uniref:M23 family metallopeptidase n=1 Tax=Microbacterium psychrotolerans TaxID=3068321 RepID=A0ABU0YZ14_9MICO|nr:M23 family metallopeptidase [Microbacterium sp. QXD-8]MDQ7877583.1 M23 family metallopeptidase [Microbacterium sp. QXD-8]
MRVIPPTSFRRFRAVTALALVVWIAAAPVTASAATPDEGDPPAGGGADAGSVSLARDWLWPVKPFRLERPFVAPAHDYGPGHRGIDLAAIGEDVVHAPAPGAVAFSGQVAGRGILTIDHGEGLVSTLEPVESDLVAGTPVAAGAAVGRVSVGGHTTPGVLHLGVRLDGRYINPLVLLGGVPRAVLLPCC